MTFNGQSFIDVTPNDNKVHITVLENGKKADYTKIKAGAVISVSSSANSSGHKYITIELAFSQFTGALNHSGGYVYTINEKDYFVNEGLINAYNSNLDLSAPKTGETYTYYTDVAGQIAKVSVPRGYSFGYLVKLSMSRSSLDPECDVKIFGEDGNMITVPLAKKVILHTGNNFEGYIYNEQPDGFVNKIIEEAKTAAGGEEFYTGDYRSIIQYTLNGIGELTEMWLPLDNTAATDYGKTGYQLTKDILKLSGKAYYGVIWKDGVPLFRIPTVPIFNVPGDLNGKDALYSITNFKQNGYNNTVSDSNAIDAYCVDEYNLVGAGVIMGASGEGDIDSYEELFIVDRVVSTVNEEKDIIYKAYGWLDGVEALLTTTEQDLVSDADKYGEAPENDKWGWEVVAFKDLKFGDVIQTYQVNNDVRRFRVVYRASNPGEDRIQMTTEGNKTDSGMYEGQIVSYGTVAQMTIITGTYYDRKEKCIRVSQNGVLNNFYMYGMSTVTDVHIIDTQSNRVVPSSVSDLRAGDTVMIRQQWGAMNDIFVVR